MKHRSITNGLPAAPFGFQGSGTWNLSSAPTYAATEQIKVTIALQNVSDSDGINEVWIDNLNFNYGGPNRYSENFNTFSSNSITSE